MERVLGIDYGAARTGIAYSDALYMTAQPHGTISEKVIKLQIEKIINVANEIGAKKIVVGLPKNMNGTIGERGEKTQRFADELREASGFEVVMWDERLSSAQAHRTLAEGKVSGKSRKGKVDTLAAVFILQSYMDATRK